MAWPKQGNVYWIHRLYGLVRFGVLEIPACRRKALGTCIRFLSEKPHTLPDGMAKRAHAQFTSLQHKGRKLPIEEAAGLLLRRMQSMAKASSVMSPSSAPVEDMHAQHRERSVQSSGQLLSLASLASTSMCRQRVMQQKEFLAVLASSTDEQEPTAPLFPCR